MADTSNDALEITAYIAAPLDSVPPVRCLTEMAELADALGRSGRSCGFKAIRPASPALISEVEPKSVLHVSSHGGRAGLELQDAAGRSAVYDADDFIAAIGSGWSLIVLNGCDTSGVGEAINAALGESVVCAPGYVPDEAAEEFPAVFYSGIARGDAIEDAVERANVLLRNRWPQVGFHYLPGRCHRLSASPGELVLSPSVNAATRAAQGSLLTVPSRRVQLIDFYEQLSGPRRGVSVTGPRQSGVTSFLKAAVEYFDWLGPNGVFAFDGRLHTDEDVAGLTSWLADTRAFVVVDHLEEADPPVQDLIRQALLGPVEGRARVALGMESAPDPSVLVDIGLKPWSYDEAEAWFKTELGPQSESWLWLLHEIELQPGRLQAFLTHISSGASEAEVRTILEEGDPRSSVRRVVDLTWSDPGLRTALSHAASYGMAPRWLLKRAWANGMHKVASAAADTDRAFGAVVADLSRRRLIRLVPIVDASGSPSSYVEVEPDVRAVVNGRRSGLTPSQREELLMVMLEGLEHLDHVDVLDADLDWVWVSRLLRESRELSVGEERSLNVIYPHLDRAGRMRMISDVRKQKAIVDAAYDVAHHIGAWDRAAQLALVKGEMRYREGQLVEAEREFRKVLRLHPSASRKLQAYRALGQVSYRRGDYVAALRHYQRAQEFSQAADPFVVTTLMQEEGKALSRLGRSVEAIEVLRQVVQRRRAHDGTREMAKALHELARALLRVRELPEARELFLLARQAGLSTGADKWSLGPTYHLFLIDLESDDLDHAQGWLDELERRANEMSERLWMTFGKLGTGMLLFAQRRYQASHKAIQDALHDATKFGYTQVTEDARDWVRRRSVRVMNAVGVDSAGDDVAELLSLVEGVPVAKAKKGLRYSSRPDLVKSLQVEMVSDHETRILSWTDDSGWSCTCPLFGEAAKCSHVVAVLLRGIAPVRY